MNYHVIYYDVGEPQTLFLETMYDDISWDFHSVCASVIAIITSIILFLCKVITLGQYLTIF